MPKKKVAKKSAKKTVKKVAKKAVKTVKKVQPKRASATLKVTKPFNKSQITAVVAERVCVSKKEANLMIDSLFEIIAAHLKKRSGVGEFTLPSLVKFKVVNKPATKARKGINPFTGEEMMFAAKPARNIVKVRALKKLKDIAK